MSGLLGGQSANYFCAECWDRLPGELRGRSFEEMLGSK